MILSNGKNDHITIYMFNFGKHFKRQDKCSLEKKTFTLWYDINQYKLLKSEAKIKLNSCIFQATLINSEM